MTERSTLCGQHGCVRVAGHGSFHTTLPTTARSADDFERTARQGAQSLDRVIASAAGLLPREESKTVPWAPPETLPWKPKPEVI